MTPDEVSRRLAEVESHLAHLERQSDDLNSMVVAQGHEISRLVRLCNRLVETIQGAGGAEGVSNERPPHYLP